MGKEYERVTRRDSLTSGVQPGYTITMPVLAVTAGLWLASGGQTALINIVFS